MSPLQSSAADSAANAVAARVAVLEALRLGLERQPSLAPGLEVNAAFGKLVELCLHCPAEDADQVMEVLNRSGSTEAIRALCATGEIELEKAWAARVIEGEGRAELRRFPYFENYVDLVRLELGVVNALSPRPIARAAFLGSGPLALSAITMSEHYGMSVTGFDRDETAVTLANRVSRRLGIESLVRSKHADAQRLQPTDLAEYDLVCLAAMVGTDEQSKRTLMTALHQAMVPGQLLLVRSAHRLRQLLYSAIDVDKLAGFMPLAELHPHNEVVNSFFVLQRV